MSTPAIESTWWEKTVEYLFVRTILPEVALAMPLAGQVEALLGDLLDGNIAAFRLIEFKRDSSTLQSELVKYKPDEAARRQYFADYLRLKSPGLLEMPGASGHWLVYAELDPATGADLRLLARRYGAMRTDPGFLVKQDADLPRVPAADLWNYMARLVLLRSKAGMLGSSGGLVVASTGNRVVAQTPIEFLSSVKQLSQRLAHVQRQLHQPSPTAPERSRGR